MSLRDIVFQTDYFFDEEQQPADVARLAFPASSQYFRVAGYFGSGVFDLFRQEVLSFVKNRGKIHLICSPELSEADLSAIRAGYSAREIIVRTLQNELDTVSRLKGANDALTFMSTLIHLGHLDIQVAIGDASGPVARLFHDKSGLFQDQNDNGIAFVGSNNESLGGWANNKETMTVFCSWKEEDQARYEARKEYILSLWENRKAGADVAPFPKAVEAGLLKISRPTLDDLEAYFEPHQTMPDLDLLDYQSAVLQNWKQHGSRGIVRFATGSGKTRTALGAIKEHLGEGNPCLIIVPSRLLLHQWHSEIKFFLPKISVLLCGDGNNRWKEHGYMQAYLGNNGLKDGHIILTTGDTASDPMFYKKFRKPREVLLVVDEVHFIGAKKYAPILQQDFSKALGLSATPERHRDEEGTERIFQLFSRNLKPEITLADAIAAGRLVPYTYSPHAIPLEDEEKEEWDRITIQLSQLMASSDDGDYEKQSRIDRLAQRRARIIKKAANKPREVCSILSNHYKRGSFWLVYCEDTDQLEVISDLIVRELGENPFKYHTGLDHNPKYELDNFMLVGGILLAINCLDEGVDIPVISNAIIVASSSNPRQFIQRRGRILRSHKESEKTQAHLFDLFVVPAGSQKMKKAGFLENEISRALEFAKDALNREESTLDLQLLLRHVQDGLALFESKMEDVLGLEIEDD